MSVETALYCQVVNTAAISAIMDDRFYPAGSVPERTSYPLATYQKISNVHSHTQGAASTLAQARFQIDCWAETAKGAFDLSETFRAAFARYRDDMGESGSTTTVRAMFLESDRADFSNPTGAKGQGTHRISMDFMISYVE